MVGIATGSNSNGVFGRASSDFSSGVFGQNSSDNGYGVSGVVTGKNGYGLRGIANSRGGQGVNGSATGLYAQGVTASSNGQDSYGVYAVGAGTNSIALYAYASQVDTGVLAGQFAGDVQVIGAVSKTSGSFKIDHPLDLANQYLYHSFVESPDMLNIYNGLVTLDGQGTATVELPAWFEALNADFRYGLTPIGEYAPLFVAEEVKGSQFKIAGGKPGQRVSWQLTGIRQDEWAKAHRIPVEEVKSDRERGLYLHPELFGQPPEKAVHLPRRFQA